MATQITADTGLAALLDQKDADGNAIWLKDEGALYPILAIAKPYLNSENKHLSVALSGADFSWLNPSDTGRTKTMTNERELIALEFLLTAAGAKQAAFLDLQKINLRNVLLPLLNGLFDEGTAETLAGKTVSAVDSSKVVGVSAQTSRKTENGSYAVRFVAEIVGTDWESAGFDLLVSYTAEDGTRRCSKLTTQEVTVCYRSVVANGETVSAPEGHFYLVFVLNGIPASNGDTTFTVSASVKDAAGVSYANAGNVVFTAGGTPADAN